MDPLYEDDPQVEAWANRVRVFLIWAIPAACWLTVFAHWMGG